MKAPALKSKKAAPAAAKSLKKCYGDNSLDGWLLEYWARDARAPGYRGVNSLAWTADAAMRLLFELAEKGDALAAELLLDHLQSYLLRFLKLCRARPEMFEPLASGRGSWPGFISRLADVRKGQETLADRLGLGIAAAVNVTGKTWTLETPETDTALRLYDLLDNHRKVWQSSDRDGELEFQFSWMSTVAYLGLHPQYFPTLAERTKAGKLARTLAPLTRQNYKEWFAAAVPMLAAVYGNDFENRKPFAAYWHPEHPAYKGESDRSRRALIRRDIKAKLKQAFRSIAPRA